jgi:hypothetical protein
LGDWGGEVNKRLTTGPEMPITTLDWSPPIPATGATAGTPGTWTPAGATPPKTVAELVGGAVVANPATAWTAGQYVATQDDGRAYWDAAAWVAGTAP